MEGLLRVMAPVPMMPRYVTALSCGVRGNMPNQIFRHSTAEYNILIRTNSKGIRSDHEIPYEKASNSKRIVLLGDSFGMGYGVSADEMFTARMVYYLKANYDITAEIVNLATSGHGNAEELIILLNEGFKYSPDLVLLSWHYTDLEDNVRSKLFGLAQGKLKPMAKAYLPGVKERQFLNQFLAYRFLAEHSQIYNFCRNWAGKKIKKWLGQARSKNSLKRKDKVKQKRKSNKKYEKELAIALLERIEKECHSKESRLVILDIPFRVTRKEFKSRFPYDYMSSTNPFAIVSPIEKFKEKRGEQIFWERGDGHFTPLGCDLVGEVLADFICNHDLLGERIN